MPRRPREGGERYTCWGKNPVYSGEKGGNSFFLFRKGEPLTYKWVSLFGEGGGYEGKRWSVER